MKFTFTYTSSGWTLEASRRDCEITIYTPEITATFKAKDYRTMADALMFYLGTMLKLSDPIVADAHHALGLSLEWQEANYK